MSWLHAAWYILSIRTNLLIIIASALGYFYLTVLRTFGVVYMRARFDLGQAEATSILVAIGSARSWAYWSSGACPTG